MEYTDPKTGETYAVQIIQHLGGKPPYCVVRGVSLRTAQTYTMLALQSAIKSANFRGQLQNFSAHA